MLDDVWRNFSREAQIHWQGHFDDIPNSQGVYAWFYPLRVTSRDLEEFLSQVRSVHLFDAKTQGRPRVTRELPMGWWALGFQVGLEERPFIPSEQLLNDWDEICSDEEAFRNLRRVVLRASLLMPPLYVGKSGCLSTRCGEHLSTPPKTGFARRFVKHAKELSLFSYRIEDLVLVTMRTEKIGGSGGEGLVEEIMKQVARPPYGVM